MKRMNYHFRSITQHIDIPRIYVENKDADFIRLEISDRVVYLYTARGRQRMDAAELLCHALVECPRICADSDVSFHTTPPIDCGVLRFSGALAGQMRSTYWQICTASTMDAKFREFYALLRERECRPIRIDVSAIR